VIDKFFKSSFKRRQADFHKWLDDLEARLKSGTVPEPASGADDDLQRGETVTTRTEETRPDGTKIVTVTTRSRS
jgi:transcription elongation GreA/GreB family factor